ncbi:RNA polymerase factor sigma-54 [Kangiella sp. TOML190]|uniref:RNA polymerase factor sigma-54 n=1 Tax=Kangiella sp. TOML190 TaxID=2931351 RepID=UPI002041ED86|nr:RNA polymerase factor sigma-54 [Kangiella sp. TOML190]
MSLELDLQLKQQLKLNPQLQQSLKLLQLSQLELTQEIQQQIYTNPLLGLEAASDEASEPQEFEPLSADVASQQTNTADRLQQSDHLVDSTDLKEQLEFQLQLHHLSQFDLEIGYYVIENLNRQGFLTVTPKEVCQQILRDLEHHVEQDEVIAIQHLIQSFEPKGCACQDLQEFLLLQLKSYQGDNKPLLKQLLLEQFQSLANGHYTNILNSLKINQRQLTALLESLKGFRQRPNDYQSEESNDYISPDIKVVHKDGHWQAELIQKQLPRVRINQKNYDLLKQSAKKDDKAYLQNKLQQAQFFIRALEARESTLQKVANYIVKHQQAFFADGEAALKPLKLMDLADTLELHESTISRATSNKYCLVSGRTIPLKSLFSHAIKNSEGGECSQAAIKNKIQQLIKAEPSRKPLSDNSIVQLLSQQGISIARRTVAKYRDALQIPSAHKRKQLSHLHTST